MKKFSLLLITILLIVVSSLNTFGQSDTTKVKHVIIKHNGNEYIGVILSDDGREVLIETEKMGKVYKEK
jgi:hypothetical protein